MSRGLYWVLAPFLLATAVILPFCISWTPTAGAVMVILEVLILGLVIGLWDIVRFEWALRGAAGIVFLAYVAYVVDMVLHGPLSTSSRAQPSVINAVVGLAVWGVPSFWFWFRGLKGLVRPEPLLFASTNPHKVEEVRAILAGSGIEVVGLDWLESDEDYEPPPEPIEDGATFEENARIKAVYYAHQTGRSCLADDSGLEVDALGGAPGVNSARFAGVGATRAERDAANNEKLLRELRDVPPEKRAARFVCAMCLAAPDGTVVAETRGEFPGVITDQPAGTNGFGYDPLLFLPDRGCTSAELAPEEKNARSHRGQAARAMAEALRGLTSAQLNR